MNEASDLRPIERRMRKLAAAGAGHDEIAWRFRRSPRHVRQVLALSTLPRSAAAAPTTPGDGLRPIERRVLRWRDGGAELAEVGARFRRQPASIGRIEQLARLKLAR